MKETYDNLLREIFKVVDKAQTEYKDSLKAYTGLGIEDREKEDAYKADMLEKKAVYGAYYNMLDQLGIMSKYLMRKIQVRFGPWDGYLSANMEINPKANERILKFIYDFVTCHGDDSSNLMHMHNVFHSGYCYYFAHMVDIAAKRAGINGTVCIRAPFGHFCWVDENGVAYDIDGVYDEEAEYYIPEPYLGKAVDDFIHINGVEYKITEEEVNEIIARYKKDTGLK